MQKYRQGFTLIELLVVLAVIGLLTVLAVVALGSAREAARDSKRLSDLREVQHRLELYFTDHSAYPAATNIVLGAGNAACFNTEGWQAANCANPYMAVVPYDPGSGSYAYTSADGTNYAIVVTLEGEIGGLSGTVQATPSGISMVGK